MISSMRVPISYQLVIEVRSPVRCEVGRLGVVDFAARTYVYTGSARRGFEARRSGFAGTSTTCSQYRMCGSCRSCDRRERFWWPGSARPTAPRGAVRISSPWGRWPSRCQQKGWTLADASSPADLRRASDGWAGGWISSGAGRGSLASGCRDCVIRRRRPAAAAACQSRAATAVRRRR